MTTSFEINSIVFLGVTVLSGLTAFVDKRSKSLTIILRIFVSAAIVFTILLSLNGSKAQDLQWYIPLYFMFLVWPVLGIAAIFSEIKNRIGIPYYILLILSLTGVLFYLFYAI